MPAKPIVDILVGVSSMDLDSGILSMLQKNGYEYLGEAGVAGRLAFRKRSQQNFNLATVMHNSGPWTNNLLIRNFLNSSEPYRKKYASTKRQAIRNGFTTLHAYSIYKENFMKELLQKAKQNTQQQSSEQ